jgi:hypothetical protein
MEFSSMNITKIDLTAKMGRRNDVVALNLPNHVYGDRLVVLAEIFSKSKSVERPCQFRISALLFNLSFQ